MSSESLSPQRMVAGGFAEGPAQTMRSDKWWLGPALTAAGLLTFIIYSTWAAFQGKYYWHGSYLSPFYSPVLVVDPSAPGSAPLHHAWFGTWPSWWPSFVPASPALLILIFPGVFRVSCYYYRKAYYRSFFGSPPGCAVCPLRGGTYRGETRFLLFQNLHRYALYFAVIFVGILYFDAFDSLFREVDGKIHVGIGVGSLVLFINATLLGAYTFGCHSWRHLVGGRLDRFAPKGAPLHRYRIWKRVSWLNSHHMLFAWTSLFWVGFSDLYVRLVSMGIIKDFHTWK